MCRRTAASLVPLLLLVIATIASGEPPAPSEGNRRTAVYLQGGLSSGASDMGGHMGGAAVGGAIVRELGSRFAIEASGSLFGRGMGSNARSLSASLMYSLRPGRGKAVPYLAVGGGIYRAQFDMGNGRFYGSTGAGMMNGGFMGGDGMMGGSTPHPPNGAWDLGQMPMFYGNRLGNRMGSEPRSGWGSQAFTDPALSLGGGIRLDLGHDISFRPDARALIVIAAGSTYTVTAFTVNVGYRF